MNKQKGDQEFILLGYNPYNPIGKRLVQYKHIYREFEGILY